MSVVTAMSSMSVVFSMSAMSTAMPMLVAVAVFMSMPVLMTVTAFPLARTRNERPREMLLHSFIRIALYAGHKFYACLGKCRLCASADAAADDEIDLRCMEEVGKRTMPFSDRICNLRVLHRAVRNIVKFELLGSAKMLFNHLLCIGYCNSHNIFSFVLNSEFHRMLNPICTARNANALPTDKRIRNLEACRLIDTRYRRTGHAHRGGTFFLCLPSMIDLTNRLELIQQQYNNIVRLFLCIFRDKTPIVRIAADTPASFWSRHRAPFSVI